MKCNRQYSELAIDHPDGRITPCCWFDISKNKNWYEYNNIYSPKQNSFLWFDLRDRFEEDWIEECHLCEKLEKENNSSLRTNYDLDDVPIRSLHLALDFNCNMMCRTCQPGLSSRWNKDKKLLNDLKTIDKNHYNNELNNSKFSDFLFDKLSTYELKNLRKIMLVGGEPFLSKNLLPFFDLLDKNKIEISIDTNSSIIPSSEILKELNKFKKTFINISIDGTEELFEIIRYGLSWKKFHKNCLQWRDIVDDVNFTSVINIMNVNKIQSIINYKNTYFKYSKINFIQLSTPNHLIHYQIPLAFRKYWTTNDLEVNKKITTDLKTENNLKKFVYFTHLMNKNHENLFEKVNPEIWEIVNE